MALELSHSAFASAEADQKIASKLAPTEFAFACRFIGSVVQRWRLPLLSPDAYSPRSPSWRPGLATWNLTVDAEAL